MDIGPYYSIIFTTTDNNRLFGPNGTDTTASNINSAASIRGMTFFASLRDVLDVPSADLNTGAVDALFMGGMAAMHISGPWNVAPFTAQGLDFGITTLPSLPGDNTPALSFSGTRAMYVSAYSEHPDEAHKFAEFLTSPEMVLLRYEITSAIPPVDMPLDSPHDMAFVKQLDYSFPMPSIPQMDNYWGAMGNATNNIWDGALIDAELDAANAAILQ
jgi:arabinogalactan oligomer/maltooligosaccharide transport system substrate-binding protein